MSRIRILPDSVANQIAAGEVVERPSSVLKELVENALDAGARRLDLRWEEGGKRLLEVADDGCGMARDELYLALERHATSKVRSAEDLGRLVTYGFRGEALPSIASVTRFELHSAESDGLGHHLRCEFGVIKDVQPAPRAQGTTVTVRDLFAQLPARKRFLKSTETEHAHLWGVVTRLALATPNVHWTLRTDRNAELHLPPVADIGQRLGPLLGERFETLHAFHHDEGPWQLRGHLSSPELSFRDRTHLYLFVNGRAVRDRLLLAALGEGWEGFFPKGTYPAVVLFLDLPPENVDVNVHPTKAEVRFREPHRIFPWVSRTLREVWSGLRHELPSVLSLPPKPEPLGPVLPNGPMASPLPCLREEPRNLPATVEALPEAFPSPLDRPYASLPEAERAAEPATTTPPSTPPLARYLGAFDATYLLFEVQGPMEPELWLVDQHVAHERILYERLFLRHHTPASQPLLPPRILQLGASAFARIAPFLDELKAVGIDCEPFGSAALALRALPDFLIHRDPQELLEDLRIRLEREGRIDLATFRRELNAELACKAAVKKHEPLDAPQAYALLQDLLACEVPHTCPHGRPILKKLTRTELERSFGRRG